MSKGIPLPLTLITLDTLAHEWVAPWLDLYETAFPPEERVLVSDFWEMLKAKGEGKILSIELLAVVDPQRGLVGMVVYEVKTEIQTALLWYLATIPELRGQGLGSQVYREIVHRVQAAGCQAMLFEVEIPDNACTAQDRVMAERRIRFYRRCGAKLITGIHYLQSVGPHQPLTPMRLMIHPLEELDAGNAFILAQGCFAEAITKVGPLGLF